MSPADLCIETASPQETRAFGRKIGEALDPGTCIGLIGTLGAGKTELVKGIAAGAGVPSSVTVNSPTFVIINEYPGRRYIYHADAFRLSGPEELSAIGFAAMLASGGAVIVEWADRVEAVMPVDRLTVRMEHVAETVRRLTLHASGPVSRRIIAALGRET